jgi:hypothetical protein
LDAGRQEGKTLFGPTPKDVREQYEKPLKDLQEEAFGAAMLWLRAQHSLRFQRIHAGASMNWRNAP